MKGQAVLDLLRVDVHPAGDDHERLSIGEEQEAVLIDVADVAGGGPGRMRWMLRFPRLVGSVVILERHDLALEVHRSDLAGGHLAPAVVTDPDDAETSLAH